MVNIPAGTRLVLVSEKLSELIGTRDERGDRLSWEWGEPDAEGVSRATITVHHDDNLVRAANAQIADRVRELADWPPERWADMRGGDPIARTINAVFDILNGGSDGR